MLLHTFNLLNRLKLLGLGKSKNVDPAKIAETVMIHWALVEPERRHFRIVDRILGSARYALHCQGGTGTGQAMRQLAVEFDDLDSDAPAAIMPHIRQILDLSTAHLSPEVGRGMTLGTVDLPWKPMQSENGFLVSTAMLSSDHPLPECLEQCLHEANRLHCDYILFDCDAPAMLGLETYAW